MRRPVPPDSRTRKKGAGKGAENEGAVARHLIFSGSRFDCGAHHRPSHTPARSSTELGNCGSDTASNAPVADGALREVSSILRWALADLAVALMEIERQLVLSSDGTQSAGGPASRLATRN